MRNKLVLLVGIVLFAAVLRLWNLGTIPEGFHADEASFGYNAYSVMKTGRDEYGVKYPLTAFKSFGDNKSPLYLYTVIPFIRIGGLSPWAVRMPSAVAGILIVLCTFGIVLEMTENSGLALLVSLLTAISPVSILLSRVQSDPYLSVCGALCAVYFLLLFVKKKSWIAFAAFVVSAFLSMWCYFLPRVFFPLFLPVFLVWKWRSCVKWERLALFAFLISFIGAVVLTTAPAHARLDQVSIFGRDSVNGVVSAMGNGDRIMLVPIQLTRLFHNKVLNLSRVVMKNSMDYLSFDFLFFEAKQPLRERIPQMGIMYLVELPLLVLGLFYAFHQKKPGVWVFALWIAIASVMTSYAVDESPNVHRFVIAALPLLVFVAWGIEAAVETGRKYIPWIVVAGCIAFLYIMNGLHFFHMFVVHQPVDQAYFRDYAYPELMAKLEPIRENYTEIVFTKSQANPYIHYLFDTKFDPAAYQKTGSHRDLDYTHFLNFYFVPEACPFSDPRFVDLKTTESGEKILFVNRGGCTLGKDAKLLDSVKWRDGLEAFQLVEWNGLSSESAVPPETGVGK